MSVITLISDWNKGDHYLACIKGYILKNCPNCQIVDISHNIQLGNILQAGFILNSCFRQFPDNTIHIIALKTEPYVNTEYFIFKIENHFFISADNGIHSLLTEDKYNKAICIERIGKNYSTFPELDVLAPAACSILNGHDIGALGVETVKPKRLIPLLPTIEDSIIVGRILYFDSYNNAISNITLDIFERNRKGRQYNICINSNKHKTTKLNKTYSEVTDGEMFCIFNSMGYLEIGILAGNPMQLLGLDLNSTIRVSFYGNIHSIN